MKRLIALMVVSLGVAATACGSKGAVAVRPIGGESPSARPGTPPPSGKPSPKPSPSGSTPTDTPPAGTLTVQVWFTQGERLYVTTRTQEATLAVGRAALTALLEGPSSSERKAGISTTIPSSTSLRGLTIQDGVATV